MKMEQFLADINAVELTLPKIYESDKLGKAGFHPVILRPNVSAIKQLLTEGGSFLAIKENERIE